MTRVYDVVEIDARLDEVWHVIGDPSRLDEYHPLITATEWKSGESMIRRLRVIVR